MKSMIKWLKDNDYNFKEVIMSDGNAGLMVDTNYNGPYPGKEVYEIHSLINKKCRRLHLNTEARGFHTALLIKENRY